MITQLQQLFGSIATSVKPEDLFLVKGSWVFFSDKFPDTHKWARGKLFEVKEEPLTVPFQASYILPTSDYKDLDLSNSTAGLKLYPENEGVLYEMGVGFKHGDYFVHIYIPQNKYIYPLGDASMFPDTGSATNKYLGAKTSKDSPFDAPLLRLYAIKDMQPWYLRPYVLEGVAFEKCTIGFQINKCPLQEIEKPAEEGEAMDRYNEMVAKAKKIMWYTEFAEIK